MKLTIIGSGTPIINLKRHASSFLLEIDDGQLLLFDCGWGCGINIVESGYDLQKIDHIFITHPHGDHLGGLINILQSIYVKGLYFIELQGNDIYRGKIIIERSLLQINFILI